MWILENSCSEGHKRSPYLLDYIVTFFKKFIDTPGIPPNVNRILLYLNGNYRFWYSQKWTASKHQHFFVEKWLETCR